jgi:hypothetical protein
MRRTRIKKHRRQRKCLNCKELYTPDYRNRRQQRYCSKPPCRLASKCAAQKQWLSSEKGQGYFQGSFNVKRVKQWRACHAGYWKRAGTKSPDALQDALPSEGVEIKADAQDLNAAALQDICLSQGPLLIGLIANLTGTTLQDVIAETSRRFIVSGRDILGICSTTKEQGGSRDGSKTRSLPRASSPCSPAV